MYREAVLITCHAAIAADAFITAATVGEGLRERRGDGQPKLESSVVARRVL